MRSLLWVCLLALGCVALTGEEEWELVFPEGYPDINEIAPLSLGAKIRKDGESSYLVGCQSGYAVLGVGGTSPDSTNWSVVKLPIAYDIHAVDVVDGQWIIGGTQGQIAIHSKNSSSVEHPDELTSGWRAVQLDSDLDVMEFACVGTTILALLRSGYYSKPTELHISRDGGYSWELLPGLTSVDDIEVQNDVFYLIEAEGPYVRLHTSVDGSTFAQIWQIGLKGAPRISKLDTFDEVLDRNQNSMESGKRLYIHADYLYSEYRESSTPYIYNEIRSLYLSTLDGNMWLDHGSKLTINGNSEPINPLELPEENRFFDWPEILYAPQSQTAVNYSLSGPILKRYSEGETTEVFRGTYRPRISTDTIAQWRDLTFVYRVPLTLDYPSEYVLVSIDRDGLAHLDDLPKTELEYRQVDQLVAAGGYYHALLDMADASNHIWRSDDLMAWEQIPLPDDQRTWTLFTDGTNLHTSGDHRVTQVYVWDEKWKTAFDNPRYPYEMVYHEGTSSWFAWYSWFEELRLTRLGEQGYFEPIGSVYPNAWWGENWHLVSPDGYLLVGFKDSSELVVFKPDGSGFLTQPWWLFPTDGNYVDSIHFINGWYYILGGATLRSRDFIEFEKVDLPNNEPLIHVTGFAGFLYGFSENAVYRKPLEKGYLNSVEQKLSWHHADWLGWFQIINEELGDIDHLLLGKCWVKPVSDLEYWIRTSTLGWIYMRKDWSPWFWRMDDGHWYWLDHDSWPPRAWDHEDQEWEVLEP